MRLRIQTNMNRSVVFKAVRFTVSAGLILYLVIRLDPDRILTHLSGIAAFPLVVASVMIFGMIFINALRWKLILKAKGLDLSLAKSVYYSLISIFFSSFLPTSVGGDFVRVLSVSNETGRPADALASVLVDRLLGFLVLLPIGLISIPFVAGQLTEWRLVLGVGTITLAFYVGAYVLVLRPVVRRLARLLDPLLRLLARFRARERLEKTYVAIVSYRDCHGTIGVGLVLSVISKIFWIGACYMVGRALSIDLRFTALLLIVPVVELVRMIPISISGIGMREAAFVAMLRQFGIADSMGFTFSVIVYVLFFGFALIGGALYGTRQFLPRR
ncbi:MAG: lysylphosphatidylglycerol synthase transmembrane domain-containing protein [Candidatus Eisenbacteria bacterium]